MAKPSRFSRISPVRFGLNLAGLPVAFILVVALLGVGCAQKAQAQAPEISYSGPSFEFASASCTEEPDFLNEVELWFHLDDLISWEQCIHHYEVVYYINQIHKTGSLEVGPRKSSSPTFTPTLAANMAELPFVGNQFVGSGVVLNSTDPTAATAAYLLDLRRLPDCSLDEDYTVPGTSPTSAAYFTSLTGAGDYLHKLAGLTTTPDVFANGCNYQTLGLPPSTSVLLLGTTSDGASISAQLAITGIYIGVTDLAANAPTYTLLPNTSSATGFLGASLRGNGIYDVVVPGLTDPTTQVSATAVFLGNGDGTFQAPVYYDGITAVTIDDMNGDGKPDIVSLVTTGYAANNNYLVYTGTAATLLGKGDGTFSPGPVSSNLNWTEGPTLTGDFNGDGKNDVLASGTVLFGGGDGSFTQGPTNAAIAVASSTNGLLISNAVGSLRNNGKLDVVVSQAGQVDIFYGNGDGTFTAGPAYAALPWVEQVSLTDLDGDGNLDIQLGSSSQDIYLFGNYLQYQILMGRGDGTFVDSQVYPVDPILASGFQPQIASADFNGDSKADVLFLGTNTSGGVTTDSLSLMPGDGAGNLGAPITSPLNLFPRSLIAADMNNDGKPDVVVAGNGSGGSPMLAVLINQGNSTFAQEQDYALPNYAFSVAVGDFNGDGLMDVAVGVGNPIGFETTGPTGVYMLFGQAGGTLAAPVQIDSSLYPTGLAAGSLTNDGRTDLVVADQGVYDYVGASDQVNGALHVYLGNADKTFTTAAQLTTPATNYTLAALGDLNKDGKLDLIVAGNVAGTVLGAGGTPTVYTFVGNGDGTFKAATALALAGTDGVGATSIALADFDNDGNLDVVVGNPYDITEILLGNGDGTLDDTGLALGQQPVTVVPAYLTGSTFPSLLVGQQSIFSNNMAVLLNTNPWIPTTTLAASTTALSVSASSVQQGTSVTLTATVTGPSGSTIVPTGTVTFYDGATALDTGSLSAGGVASIMTTTLPLGPNSITAVYSGDGNYTTSTSTAMTVTVTAKTLAASTTMLAVSAASVPQGTSVTLTATVTGPSGSTIVPTGTATFYDGTTTLGSGSLSAGGVATIMTATLPLGANSITAVYSGDGNYTTSTSTAKTVTVTSALIATSTTLTSSAANANLGSTVTFTATVSANAGTPTWTVTFLNGNSTLGTGTLNGSGVATYSTSTLAAGSYSLTASYGGDTTYAPSVSMPLAQVVTAPGYTVTFNPTALTIKQGASGTTTLTVTPVGGFNQQISLSCSGLPALTTCAFSPSTLTPDGSGTALTSVVTISTDVKTAMLARPGSPFRSPGKDSPLLAIAFLGLAGIFSARRKAMRKGGRSIWTAMILAFALLSSVAVAGLSGCGGTGTSTPKGTTTISVIATSAGSNQSANFTLTVD